MLNVAINVQEEDWEDDGGAHDPFIVSVEKVEEIDAAFGAYLRKLVEENKVEGYWPKEVPDLSSAIVKPPCMVDGVFPIWFKY